jgi:integrase
VILTDAIDAFVTDWKADGRMRSEHTERAYRECLDLLADQVGRKHVEKVTKADLTRLVARWEHPNSRRQKLAILRAFFRWAVWEGYCDTNVADKIRQPKWKEPVQRRLTRDEAVMVLKAATSRRERWAMYLMLLAGLRNEEVRSLRGRHLARDGWVWVESGKGGKERWVPVTGELEPIIAEIRTLVGPEDLVLPSRVRVNPPHGDEMAEVQKMLTSSGLGKIVSRVGDRAGLPFQLRPHDLRHTFAQHAIGYAGTRSTQAMLGHRSHQTTVDTYTAGASLDEIAVSMHGFAYGVPGSERPSKAPEDHHA